jgi:hypothetical protein
MPACAADNDYDGRMGVRISAIFVIGVTSLFCESQLLRNISIYHVLILSSDLVPCLRC